MPRLWVISSSARRSSSAGPRGFPDLRLDDHVERRRRLVRDDHLRLEDQRQRDHDALAHAARELVRVLAEAGGWDAHAGERLERADSHLVLGEARLVGLERLEEVLLDRDQGIEAGHRLLEDQSELGTAQLAHLLCRHVGQIAPPVEDLARDAGAVGRKAEKRPAQGGLAASGFPDQAEGLSRADVQAHPVDRAHRLVLGRVPDAEVLGLGAPAHARLGSSSARGGLVHLRLSQAPGADHWVQHVVEPLADQREAGHQEDDRHSREEAGPPDTRARVVDRAVEVIAPFRRFGRLDAVAEESERGEGQDRVGGVEGRDRRHVLDHVLEDVAADDREPRCAQGPGRLDVGLLADADHVVSDHAEVLGYVDRCDGERGGEYALAELVREEEGDHDGQQEVGEGEQRVHDQDEAAVELAADVARDEPQRDADGEREDESQDDDLDRGPRTPDDAREDVRRLDRRAEQMRAVGRPLLWEAHAVRRHLVEAVGGDPRCEDREDDEEHHDDHAREEDPAGHAGRLEEGLEDAWASSSQYLTLGSMKALMRSITSEMTTTARAKTVMIPWTAM